LGGSEGGGLGGAFQNPTTEKRKRWAGDRVGRKSKREAILTRTRSAYGGNLVNISIRSTSSRPTEAGGDLQT